MAGVLDLKATNVYLPRQLLLTSVRSHIRTNNSTYLGPRRQFSTTSIQDQDDGHRGGEAQDMRAAQREEDSGGQAGEATPALRSLEAVPPRRSEDVGGRK
jgi:hypothetical protein